MPKKLILDVEEDLWKEVLKYKIDKSMKNNNVTVIELVKNGLKKLKK